MTQGTAPQEGYLEQESGLGDLLRQLRVRKYRSGGFPGEYVSDALYVLKARGLRSFLTILSIFVGVAAVIVTLVWTQGIGVSLNDQLINLGTNVISVSSASPDSAGLTRPVEPLTTTDVQALGTLPHLLGISPILGMPQTEVVSSQRHWKTNVVGVSRDFPTMQDWQMAEGSWFSSGDQTRSEPSAVLGATVAQQLTDAQGRSPLGQQIRISTQLFHVSGILLAKGGGFNQDDVVFVSFQTALLRLRNTTALDQIEIQVDSIDNIDLMQ